MKRTVLLRLIGITVLLLGVCEVASPASTPRPAIKIGFVDAYTGGLVGQSRDFLAGAEIFFAEKGWEVAGRKMTQEAIEDTKLDPSTALTKVKKVVLQDKVNLVMGIGSSADLLAARDYVHQQAIPLLACGASIHLTRDLYSRYIFRIQPATTQYPFGSPIYAAKKGYKKAITIGTDIVPVHEVALVIKAVFKEKGGEIIDELWSPWGTTDFSPYLAKIIAKKDVVDVVFGIYWGADAPRFITQYDEYGLKKAIPLFSWQHVADSLAAAGKHGVGIINCGLWGVPTLDLPANKKFVEAFKKKRGCKPSGHGYLGYYAARMVWEALNKINGEIENTSQFLDALEKADFKDELTGGRVRFDERHGIILDLFCAEVREVGGEFQNYIIDGIREELPEIRQIKDDVIKFPASFFKK